MSAEIPFVRKETLRTSQKHSYNDKHKFRYF